MRMKGINKPNKKKIKANGSVILHVLHCQYSYKRVKCSQLHQYMYIYFFRYLKYTPKRLKSPNTFNMRYFIKCVSTKRIFSLFQTIKIVKKMLDFVFFNEGRENNESIKNKLKRINNIWNYSVQ